MNQKERDALVRYANGENFTHDVVRHLVKRLLEKERETRELLAEEERETGKLHERLKVNGFESVENDPHAHLCRACQTGIGTCTCDDG